MSGEKFTFVELAVEQQARKEAIAELPLEVRKMFTDQIEHSVAILKKADQNDKATVMEHQAKLKEINERLDIVVATYKDKLELKSYLRELY